MPVQLSPLHKISQGGGQMEDIKRREVVTEKPEPIEVQLKPEAMKLIVEICVNAMLRSKPKEGEQS